MENLINDVVEIIAPIAECELDEIQADTDLPNELGIDSIRGLEIMVMIERKFKVKLPEDQLPNMVTPRAIAEMLQPLLEPVA